jgi:hypothetical protein
MNGSVFQKLWLPALCGMAVLFSCSFENEADADLAGDLALGNFPRTQVNFTPPGITACCWHIRNSGSTPNVDSPAQMIDGSTSGNYWDWAWGFPAVNTDYPALGGMGYVITPGTGHADYFNHASFINRDGYNNNRPCHFYTVDLGAIKYGIKNLQYYPRNSAANMIAQYEIWVSDYPIGVDPQASLGAYMAAKGSWTYAAAWFTADFSDPPPLGNGGLIPHARYIQVRSYADGDGTGDFQICGMETRVTIWGSFDGNVNVTNLTVAISTGAARLKNLSKASTFYPALIDAMDAAFPLVAEAEEVNDPASGKTEAEKLAVQERVDTAAAGIIVLVTESQTK